MLQITANDEYYFTQNTVKPSIVTTSVHHAFLYSKVHTKTREVFS